MVVVVVVVVVIVTVMFIIVVVGGILSLLSFRRDDRNPRKMGKIALSVGASK